LDHYDLHDDGNEHDHKEHLILENAIEHVELSLEQLSGVDLIEHLHEHEGLEDKSEVQSLLGGDVGQLIVGPGPEIGGGSLGLVLDTSLSILALSSILLLGFLPGVDLTSPLVKSGLIESDVGMLSSNSSSSKCRGILDILVAIIE